MHLYSKLQDLKNITHRFNFNEKDYKWYGYRICNNYTPEKFYPYNITFIPYGDGGYTCNIFDSIYFTRSICLEIGGVYYTISNNFVSVIVSESDSNIYIKTIFKSNIGNIEVENNTIFKSNIGNIEVENLIEEGYYLLCKDSYRNIMLKIDNYEKYDKSSYIYISHYNIFEINDILKVANDLINNSVKKNEI
jgi:hypothetical protein